MVLSQFATPSSPWKIGERVSLPERIAMDENLHGVWDHESSTANLWMTFASAQTIQNPAQIHGFEPSNGSIIIDDINNSELKYMFYISPGYYYEDAFQLFLGNNPLIDVESDSYFDGDSIPENVILPYYRLEYFSAPSYQYFGGDLVVIDTLDGQIIEKWYMVDNSSGSINIDSSFNVVVNNLTVTSEDYSPTSYTLSGMLVPDTLHVNAGEETEVALPIFTSDFSLVGDDESMQWQFYSDGTGREIYSGEEYYYSWSDTVEIEWYTSNDSLYVVNYDNEDNISDTMGLAYSINNDILNLEGTMNFCEMMDDYEADYCYDMMEMMIGADDIQEIKMRINIMMNFNDGTFAELDPNYDESVLPTSFNLNQNYPNPFNPITSIQYELPEDALVNITIYDMMGRNVKTLINGLQKAGYRSVQWNATNSSNEPVSAGLYIYTIQSGNFLQTRKMVLVK